MPRPLDEPSTATFSILRYRFARLTGKIADHFQKLSKRGTYAEVVQLDQELVEFAQNLPPHFRVEQANESMDDVVEGLALSRYMLGTEIMMIRIMLHVSGISKLSRRWDLSDFSSDHGSFAGCGVTSTPFRDKHVYGLQRKTSSSYVIDLVYGN